MDKLKNIGRIIRGWTQSKNGLVWGVISVSVLIIASVISLIISVYTKDEPKIIPQETRGAVREGVRGGVAEPVAKIAPQIGQAIINAAYKDSPSGSDLKPTGPAGSNGAPAVDTSNWSVYRDEKLGFEIRYPEGYTQYRRESKQISFASKSDIQKLDYDEKKYMDTGFPYWGGKLYQLKITENAGHNTLIDYAKTEYGSEASIESMLVDGKLFMKVIDRGPDRYGGGTGFYYITEKNNQIYEIGLDYFFDQKPDNLRVEYLGLIARSLK